MARLDHGLRGRLRGGLHDANWLRGGLHDVHGPRSRLWSYNVVVLVVMAMVVANLVRLVPAMVARMMMATGNAHNCGKRQDHNDNSLHIWKDSFLYSEAIIPKKTAERKRALD